MGVGSICGLSSPTPPIARETSPAPFPSFAIAAVAAGDFGLKSWDGEPAPTTPPPGPVPVNGIPQPAAAPGTGGAAAGASAAGRADDLVPADREYLRPTLIRYAQANGIPADLVMALAWVESSWRP